MKLWQKMCGARTVRAALTCSLALLATAALAGPYGQLRDRLHSARNIIAKIDAAHEAGILDPELDRVIEAAEGTAGTKALEDYVELAAEAESGSAARVDESAAIRDIKSSPFYSDPGQKKSANWLRGAIDRLRNIGGPETPKIRQPNLSLPGMGGQGLIYFVYFILVACALAFIIYALRFVSLRGQLRRKAKAMLEEDEPERTLDEWLALADAYERDGNLREAVRALYLACLLRFDENGVARFMRGQTNWEHLRRIDASPKLPSGINFRAPTEAFDQIWYGHRLRGPEDVAQFRNWYTQITDAMRRAAA